MLLMSIYTRAVRHTIVEIVVNGCTGKVDARIVELLTSKGY